MSAYGAGAPTYTDVELQRSQIEGRVKVARGIANRAQAAGDNERAARWNQNADELLDRLLELRGR